MLFATGTCNDPSSFPAFTYSVLTLLNCCLLTILVTVTKLPWFLSLMRLPKVATVTAFLWCRSNVITSRFRYIIFTNQKIVTETLNQEWHHIHTKFHQNPSNRSRVETCGQLERQIDWPSLQAFFSCTLCKERVITGETWHSEHLNLGRCNNGCTVKEHEARQRSNENKSWLQAITWKANKRAYFQENVCQWPKRQGHRYTLWHNFQSFLVFPYCQFLKPTAILLYENCAM
jgi:hypothetical protein